MNSTAPVAIVGAGPAGLSIARALRRVDVPYVQYERHTDIGGIWDIDNPGTPMYESAHFISSRRTSGFHDFPMPDTYPDYPGHRQILAYTRAFADAFGLRDAIRCGTEVVDVDRDTDGDGWTVVLADGTRHAHSAVVCASGVTWTPRSPRHEGRFDGEIRHSVTHRSGIDFRGKRVLIVGLGNSGADIACDAAQNADAAFVSVRRGYHIVPKHVFGRPVDELDDGAAVLPRRLEQLLVGGALRLLQGDLSRWGLPKPDHRPLESHPLVNSQLLHHLQHGDVAVRPDVDRLDGRRVRFVDGTSEELDLILHATGYDWSIPYAQRWFSWRSGRTDLYLTAFERRHRGLFGLGLLETISSAYTLFDDISTVVAGYLHARNADPAAAAHFDRLIAHDRTPLTGGIRFVDSDRHRGYVDHRTFRRRLTEIRRRLGWPGLTPGCDDRLRRNPLRTPAGPARASL
ncbi:flavin-containing monooxygenase [Pseudonocardia alni]|uniref:flavin-containing monooxygenase n=1 Tax=Pseudonocardia alni TaxID=33907 RepID=UPI0033E86848